MAEIISIGTALPPYRHHQQDMIGFMSQVYRLDNSEKRKLSFLYNHSSIDWRYSVIDDFSQTQEAWDFISREGDELPTLDDRMKIFDREALPLTLAAIKNCLEGQMPAKEITHLITVSCTGMTAPGLDLQIVEALQLSPAIFRTSINFMGCYAAIHALKLAKLICDSVAGANILIADTELCTIHFQKQYTPDNAASSLLFADGSAAVLVSNSMTAPGSLSLRGFYSWVQNKGKKDMAWEISKKGFLMTLSGYIPQLIEQDIQLLVQTSLKHHGIEKEAITHWCVHPGGRKIIDTIEQKLRLLPDDLCYSRKILRSYGNMSSPTILFVLKEMMAHDTGAKKVFGMSFGPGLTMETFIAATDET